MGWLLPICLLVEARRIYASIVRSCFFIADMKTGAVMFTGVVYNLAKGQLTAPPERKE